jgi:hypothetical protein
MSKTKRNDRKAEVIGVSSGESPKRYKMLLEQELGVVDIPDRGQYVSLHKRIRLPDKMFIDIIVYSTDTIYVSGSAYIKPEEFARIATKIIELAQQAITPPLEKMRPISVQRAKDLLGFAGNLNLDKDYERMIAIILADTCNEIVLREKMKALNIDGVPLDDNIPEKIKRLKAKGCQIVDEEAIKNVRETRNRIVHYGDIPHKGQAEESLKIADHVLQSV